MPQPRISHILGSVGVKVLLEGVAPPVTKSVNQVVEEATQVFVWSVRFIIALVTLLFFSATWTVTKPLRSLYPQPGCPVGVSVSDTVGASVAVESLPDYLMAEAPGRFCLLRRGAEWTKSCFLHRCSVKIAIGSRRLQVKTAVSGYGRT